MNKYDCDPPRGFDDPRAVSLFKLALIEVYCRDEISAAEVRHIFEETPALRGA